jgi:hypothetical protein
MWTVPRLWEGQTCAILASGPSTSHEVVDTVRAAGVRAIVVNTTFQLAPWADMLYAADVMWWQHYRKRALEFAGLKVSCSPTPFKAVLQLKPTGKDGFDANPGNIRTGNNSGYQAVHIAMHAGAKRILLCGFDMRGGHWHGDHPHPLRNDLKDAYPRYADRFAGLVDPARERRIDIVNCTAGSAIGCFRFGDLKEELAPSAVLAA